MQKRPVFETSSAGRLLKGVCLKWALFLLLGVTSPALAQVCSGYLIQLNSQTDVNDFQANHGPCTHVTGFLDITDLHTPGDEIIDLSPLSALISVGEAMWISGTSVTSLAGLENLSSVKNLGISYNPDLANLVGLGGLVSVFALGISENSSLASLAGLNSLTAVERLTIWGNSSLQRLDTWTGLSSLSSLARVSIGENNLDNLAGLPGLLSLDQLILGEANLSGLPGSLAALGLLEITGNAVTSLVGLPPTLQAEELRIGGTTGLVSLAGLPVITGLQLLYIVENEALTDLGALAASSMNLAVPQDTAIYIEWNFNLPSLAGLPATSRLGNFRVADNGNLTSLGAPAGLQEIWGELFVADNPKLSDCEILRTVLDETDDGDPGPGMSMDPMDPPDTRGLMFITIENNQSLDPDLPPPQRGCDSIEEILASSSNVIHADGFEGG